MPMILTANTRRWHGLALAVVIVMTTHMTVAPDASRIEEPWPMLLSGEPVSLDPGVAVLQQRASGSLEKLLRSVNLADFAPEQPL
jgi:hypothetical protein